MNPPLPQQQQQQQQPKELLDFFTSLENEKVNIFYNPIIQQQPMFSPVMAQTTGHNPFRTNENMMMTTIPQQSTSTMLPQQQTGTANPFRSSTMPQMSTSTPTLPYYDPMNNFQSLGNAAMMQQPQQLQQQMIQPAMNNNPFAMSSVASPPSTIMVAPSATGSNNPFNNATPKHQQLQPWGSSLF